MSRLSRQCGILTIAQPYRPPRPVTGIPLLLQLNLYLFSGDITGKVVMQLLALRFVLCINPTKNIIFRYMKLCSLVVLPMFWKKVLPPPSL
jgi:hypothetical protein